MKFARFRVDSEVYQGILEDGRLKAIKGDMFGEWQYTGTDFSEEDAVYLAPLQPNQVIGIGANFVGKPEDLPDQLPDIPVFFYKPVASVIGAGEDVVIPAGIAEVKFESELAVVIGKQGRDIAEKDVDDHIFGYTIGNDITAPQFFHQDGHWTIGKSFDTFTPLGPVIETDLGQDGLRVKAFLNGEEKQNSPTEFMIFSVRKMVAYLSTVMTLNPGDVILTGSPVGAEMIKEGDTIDCRIDGIGSLANLLTTKNKEAVHR
ncbi:MAG: fumarylacetoacetate hydrolase family protein [Bacillus sp. (in: firmicutes)]